MKSPFYTVGMGHIVKYLLDYKLLNTLYFKINKDYTLQVVLSTFLYKKNR